MNELFRAEGGLLFVLGSWDRFSVAGLRAEDFLSFEIFDFSGLKKIDTAGVRFFLALKADAAATGRPWQARKLAPRLAAFFELCEKNYTRLSPSFFTPGGENKKIFFKNIFFKKPPDPPLIFFKKALSKLGMRVMEFLKILRDFIAFTGLFFAALFSCVKNPRRLRLSALIFHIEESALRALPIVILTAFLVGIVLAYQAAFQLSRFGANIFIVDLVGLSATRELAPLIAAIVIAGRSASAAAAQIGVMKLTDEIAAMNTMGFASSYFIILPRVLALAIAMPLIVSVSDAVSIFGAMLVAKFNLEINFYEFMRRFFEAVNVRHIIIGLVKAPVFGLLISLIAAFRGLGVASTTQSIGVYTTKAVVNALFWVIAFDALFSIVLTQMGI